MKVSQIYVYPIKSLRGVPVSSAQVTRTGFEYDRRFMLLKVTSESKDAKGEKMLKNMHIPHFPEMSLFRTELLEPGSGDKGRIKVTYHPPGSESAEQVNETGYQKEEEALHIPLNPDTRGLEQLAVVMHRSPTKGYNMGPKYNEWFSERFGYDVVLAYLGDGNGRAVLGTFAPAKHVAHKDQRQGLNLGYVAALLVVIGVLYIALTVLTPSPPRFAFVAAGFLGRRDRVGVMVAVGALLPASLVLKRQFTKDERITFADTAPYMVVSETSVANVTDRLEGEEIDVRKFRANIVVSGAETAFEEDFWAELVIGDAQVRLLLTANCVRCRSLDVDYETGKMGTGESGKVLKKLMADRRVDTGAKYSPVFGRYAFLEGQSDLKMVRVGDEVIVARNMKERAIYDWPGLA
jgi:glycine hydroxymethyltransferase